MWVCPFRFDFESVPSPWEGGFSFRRFVGFSMNGNLGFQAKQVQKFAHRISQALQLPIEYVDERLTSHEATNQLKAQKRFSTYNKGLIDRQAAAIILQRWLDEKRQLRKQEPEMRLPT